MPAHRMNPATARVRVPASTSNLGPGFDVLGLALKLYNEVEVRALGRGGADRIEVAGEGEGSLPRDGTNVAARAVRSILPRGSKGGALLIRLVNRIPMGRGLGSSAAARLGGLLAGRALSRGRGAPGDDALIEKACALEGHMDNVVTAYHGGLCAFLRDEGRVRFFRARPPAGLKAVVCVPDFELPTEKARRALPRAVPLRDAVATAARTAFLLHALENGRFDLLPMAMKDVLHQPYRRRLIPGMDGVIASALRAGALGCALSGSGSAMFAFSRPGRACERIGRAMKAAFSRSGVKSRHIALDFDGRGAVVERC